MRAKPFEEKNVMQLSAKLESKSRALNQIDRGVGRRKLWRLVRG
jgi:hypothetical protein